MRCPDCNKFVSNEEAEPEVDSVEYVDGSVTASVRIHNDCAECGTELSEATLDLEQDISDEIEKHVCAKREAEQEPEFEVSEDGAERTSRSGYYKKGVWVPSGGRYAKTFYGAEIQATVTCGHCQETVATVSLADEVQASSMDPLN